MKKILLLAPPFSYIYGNIGRVAGRYFPLGLGYIAAYLKKYGNYNVKLVDFEAQELQIEEIKKIIDDYNPSVIGITCSTPTFSNAVKLASLCKTKSDAKIILGGAHASALPEFIIENYSNCFDYVVMGEGEETILELLDSLFSNKDIQNVKGIVFKHYNKIINTGKREFIQNLDTIPLPDRDILPNNIFFPSMFNARYKNCFTIVTSRGCPLNCKFCASRIITGKKYRMHSAEYVLEEMEILKKKYNAKQLIIFDDTFTFNHGRLEKICRGMINKKFNFKWFCFSQINIVNEEILKLMKSAGCYSISFGLESGNSQTLKTLGKPISPNIAPKIIKIAKKLGYKTQASYILGTPGESVKQMYNTINYSKKVGTTLAFFMMLVPYPGTIFFDKIFSKDDFNSINWNNFVSVGENSVLNDSIKKEELEKIIAKANISYYANPKRIISILYHIRTFLEFKNYLKSAIQLFKQIIKWNKK